MIIDNESYEKDYILSLESLNMKLLSEYSIPIYVQGYLGEFLDCLSLNLSFNEKLLELRYLYYKNPKAEGFLAYDIIITPSSYYGWTRFLYSARGLVLQKAPHEKRQISD